ncbi:RDD family protein [Pseudalkalibacillus caeni]|uniref:RDD family protein n=1 Tax=Exobacillus caeni TaxID=2574798 RepID=A0A5R9FHQ5_9BACL|nr:RDD family protein [Pseudalkalibacillus caeni]TLS39105.1 RDD family protein [Pseudalkalibacillus caeni]
MKKNETIQTDHAESDYSPSITGESTFHYRYAGFWMRFWAYLLDLIVIGSINRIIINPFIKGLDFPWGEPDFLPIQAILTGIVFYGYFVLMTKFFQQTLGKMAFGLKVVGKNNTPLDWPTVLFREFIGRFISKFILFVGYIVTAFTSEKQGLHDIFADTLVIHENEIKLAAQPAS